MSIDPADAALALERSARLSEIAREYARYSRSAGGLSAVLGGVLLLASWGLAPVLVATLPGRIALALVPFAWLLARQVATRHYQRFGIATEREPDGARRQRAALVVALAIVCALVVAGAFSGASPFGVADPTVAGRTMYVGVVMALPLIVALTLRTPLDLVVGVFLLAQAAGAALGGAYASAGVAIVFPFAALLLVAAGLRDHRRFRALARALLRERTPGAA